jgi:hypothetical protein
MVSELIDRASAIEEIARHSRQPRSEKEVETTREWNNALRTANHVLATLPASPQGAREGACICGQTGAHYCTGKPKGVPLDPWNVDEYYKDSPAPPPPRVEVTEPTDEDIQRQAEIYCSSMDAMGLTRAGIFVSGVNWFRALPKTGEPTEDSVWELVKRLVICSAKGHALSVYKNWLTEGGSK